MERRGGQGAVGVLSETVWWPGWRHMLGDRLPLVVVVGIAAATIVGYLTALVIAAKAERYERKLREGHEHP